MCFILGNLVHLQMSTCANLGGTRWYFIKIKKKIGTQIRLDEDLNLGGLGLHN